MRKHIQNFNTYRKVNENTYENEYIGEKLMRELAEKLGTVVVDNKIEHNGTIIEFFSETEKFHIGKKSFSTIDEVLSFLDEDKDDSIQESVWPKADLSDTFSVLLSDELKKRFKGIFYVDGKKLYHNDKPLFNIKGNDSVEKVVNKVARVKLSKHMTTIHNTLIEYVDDWASEEGDEIMSAWQSIKSFTSGESIPKSTLEEAVDIVHTALTGYVEDALGKKSGEYIDDAWNPIRYFLLGYNQVNEKKSVPKKGTPDYHQHKIAVDTIKNPNKGLFMKGPSVEEAKDTLRKKFNYTDKDIEKLSESLNIKFSKYTKR
jgi:hemoglobin-like flavoprotein